MVWPLASARKGFSARSKGCKAEGRGAPHDNTITVAAFASSVPTTHEGSGYDMEAIAAAAP